MTEADIKIQGLQSTVTRGLSNVGFKYFQYREDESIQVEHEGIIVTISFKIKKL